MSGSTDMAGEISRGWQWTKRQQDNFHQCPLDPATSRDFCTCILAPRRQHHKYPTLERGLYHGSFLVPLRQLSSWASATNLNASNKSTGAGRLGARTCPTRMTSMTSLPERPYLLQRQFPAPSRRRRNQSRASRLAVALLVPLRGGRQTYPVVIQMVETRNRARGELLGVA